MKNQSNAAGAWIKSHLINSSLCLPPAHLARWATKVTSHGDQEYLNKQLKSIMDVLWKTIQNCWDTWNQTWLSHSSSEVFSNIEMQMREREPAAKRLVLGNLVIWTRSLQFPQGDLYKNESQTSFLCFTASFPSFTAPICTDHSLGEWGSKSTSGEGGWSGDCTHSWWFLEHDHFTAGEGLGRKKITRPSILSVTQ